MATDIVMPRMGYDMTEGKLVRWLKREGDTVAKGEPVAEIETDKVTIEVEAYDAGVLRRLVAQEGQTVPVGERIAILTAPDVQLTDDAPSSAPPAGATAASPASSGSAAGGAVPAGRAGAARPSTPRGGDGGGEIDASPLARRLAREHGVDLAQIKGTGPNGRITREDVLAAAGGAPAVAQPDAAAAPTAGATAAGGAPAAATTGAATTGTATTGAATTGTGEQPLTRLQQTMGRRMAESKRQAPHFYLTMQVDMTAAMALRRQRNEGATGDAKISVNDLIVTATARALTAFPTLNASFTGDRLALHDEISISVAVALDEGLVTPVVRHADKKALDEIARETKGLAERARAGKSRLEDYEGGTFTVSNLGMFDIDTFIAIINPPQAAILAVGAVRRVPVYIGDGLFPREMVGVTLSADHRVIDGATGARFLTELRGYLEHPDRLLS